MSDKEKKECPECGDEFVRLSAHMVVHKDDVKEEEVNVTIVLEALQDTQLPDGEFVPEGKRLEVSESYSEKVLSEPNPHFKKVDES